jgi:hypothetical protein
MNFSRVGDCFSARETLRCRAVRIRPLRGDPVRVELEQVVGCWDKSPSDRAAAYPRRFKRRMWRLVFDLREHRRGHPLALLVGAATQVGGEHSSHEVVCCYASRNYRLPPRSTVELLGRVASRGVRIAPRAVVQIPA